jgi:hypothetical protein
VNEPPMFTRADLPRVVRALLMLSIGVAFFVALVNLAPQAVSGPEPRYMSLGLFVALIAVVRMLGRFEPPK